MGTMRRGRLPCTGAMAALLMVTALAAPASALEVLEAADHAELSARVSATEVTRIALEDDRIAQVIRSPGGFEAEHDPARGDLYLRPLGVEDAWNGEPEAGPDLAPEASPDMAPQAGPDVAPQAEPEVLFIGTEKGFTYRLALVAADGGPAQLLIRNPAAAAPRARSEGNPRIGALVELVRAVARRAPPGGYAVEAGARRAFAGFEMLEVWRGPRFEALVLALGAGAPEDAAALAFRLGPGVAAVWTAPPGTGPGGGRLAVAVRERAARAGQAGDGR